MNDALVIEAIRKTMTVDCGVDEAFRIFTADMLSWWPVETHSIHKRVAEIVLEPRVGGELFEVSVSGEKGHWADVLEWEPPSRLVLAWNISNGDESPTEVEVRFLPEGDGTRIELEHRGWERLAEDGAGRRESYDGGWDVVLGTYVERMAGTVSS